MPRTVPLTVAVATMNRPDALARCLDALLAGSVLPAEIVIIDQGEGEEAQAVVEQRRCIPVAIRYFQQPARGLSKSRNVAVALANHALIAVTDDDCVPDECWVESLADEFAAPDAPDAVTGRVLPLGSDQSGGHSVSSRVSTEVADFTVPHLPWLVGTGANFAVKREWFSRIGYYHEGLGTGSPGRAGEDLDMLYRLLSAGAHIRYQPKVLVYHERQSKARRIASRSGYGHGVGACCAVWLRGRDPYALVVLMHWIILRMHCLLYAAYHRQWASIHEEWLVLRGTASGLRYGLVRKGMTGEINANQLFTHTP